MPHCCDVLILGGAAAGATAARVCATGGARVLVAAARPKRALIGECLAPRGRRLLASLHPLVRQDRHAPYVGTRSRWARDEIDETSFLFNPDGKGLRLDRAALDEDLRNSAEAAGATWRETRHLVSVRRRGERWSVEIAIDGSLEEIDAAAVIDCSGRSHLFAHALGVGRRFHDSLLGLVLDHRTDDEDGRLTIDAAPLGWWYSVIAPRGRRVTAFMTDPDIARSEGLRRPGALKTLCCAEGGVLAERSTTWPVCAATAVTAATTRLEQFAGKGWCAAGDAAATYDPLSSQGIIKAIETGGEAGKAALNHNFVAYSEWLEDEFERYLRLRGAHYSANRRWKHSDFWRRRSVPVH